jgi:parallel beta-helix repeat protein
MDSLGQIDWIATSSLGMVSSIEAGTPGQIPYYRESSNYLFSTSSIFIASNGYVGIGTTTPDSKLSVEGDIMLAGDDRYLNFGYISGADGYGIRENGGYLQYRYPGGNWSNMGSSTVGSLNDILDVAITSPAYGALLMYDGSSDWIDIATSSLGLYTGFVASGAPGYIPYYRDYSDYLYSTSSLYISGNNYVGIGTTTPDTLFHVDGDATFDRICLGGSCASSLGGFGLGTSNVTAGEPAVFLDGNTLTSTSTMNVAYGGTGHSTWDPDELVFTQNVNTLNTINKGSNNTVFYIDSSGNYTWTATSSWDTDTYLVEQDITDFGFIKGLTLGNLYDVSTSSLATNDVLYWDGDSWETTGTSTWDTDTNTQLSDPEIGAFGYIKGLTLGNLWDVSTSSLATNHILYWDGDSWETSATTTWTHDMVTLAGTENYLTISGQEISVNEIDISEHTSLSVTALGLTLNDDAIELTNNYIIPLSASTTNWNNFYDTPSTVITAGDNIAWNGNQLDVVDIWWSSLSEMPLTTGQLYVGYGNIPVATSTIFVDTTQNYVGIGTTTPDTLFHVDGDATFDRICLGGSCASSLGGFGLGTSNVTAGEPAVFLDGNTLTSTSTMNVAYGGTGHSTWDPDELVFTQNVNTLNTINKGSNNTVFYIDSSGNYTWTATSSWDTDTYLVEQDITDFGFIKGLTLGNLYDVSTSSLATNHVLYWDGDSWETTGTSTWDTDTNTQLSDPEIGAFGYIKGLTLGNLWDVSTSSLATNHILYWDGDSWETSATTTWTHDMVTLAGTENYLTISGQEISVNEIDISEHTSLSVTALGLTLNDDAIELTNNYIIPLSASTTNWNNFYDTPSTVITAGDNIAWNGNQLDVVDIWWSSLSEMPLTTGQLYVGYGNIPVATSTIFVDTTQNYVGIGTTTPDTLFHVDGDGSFGRLCFNGDCIDSWTSAGIAIDSGRVVGQIAYWTDTNELGSTSTIPTGFGGTGKTSWNTDELIYSIDANTLGNITKGGNNTVFYIDSTGNYTWTATSSWDTNTQLAKQDILNFGFIEGSTLGNLYDVSTSSLNDFDILYWDGSQWTTTATSSWDTDTGWTALDEMNLTNGYVYTGYNSSPIGTSSIFIDAITKNVGIGTTSPTDRLAIDGGIVLTGNIMPYLASSSQNIGSSDKRFKEGWFDQLYANNMNIGSTSISGSNSNIFTINSDNATADAEDSIYEFERGTASPNAQILWDVSESAITFNFPIGVEDGNEIRLYEDSGSGTDYAGFKASSTMSGDQIWTLPASDGSSGQALMTDSNGILYWGDPSGAGSIANGSAGWIPYYAGATNALSATSTIFIDTTVNYIGIGTTTPDTLFHVDGDATFDRVCLGGVCKDDWTTAGAFDGGGLVGQVAVWTDSDSLTASNTIQTAYGGTGKSGWTQYAIPYLTDTNTFGEIEIGDASYVLAVNATQDGYIWMNASSTGATYQFQAQYSPAQTGIIQVYATSTLGNDFSIVSDSNTHTFYLPDAGASSRGLLSASDWNTFNDKWDGLDDMILDTGNIYVGYGNIPVSTSTIFVDTAQNYVGIGTTTPDTLFHVDGDGSFGRLCFNGDCIDSWTSAGIAIDSGRVVGQIAYWTDTNELGSTSTIPTGFGGTGKTSWNTDELIYSIDANTLGNITKGGNNTVFYIDSTGNYTWTATSSWDTNTQLAEQDITDFGFIKGLTLGNLYDVSTSSLATNDVLYWDGDSWETTGTSTWDTDTNTQLSDPEIGAFGYIKGLTLGNLWDVSTSSLNTNHILYWDGDSWETSATTTWTHDMVTLAGTENYLTISGQEISVNEIDISEHTSLSVTALGLTLNDDAIELTNNYIIPLSASTTNWNNFYDTPSTVITAGDNIAWNGNQLDVADIWWSSLSEMPLTTGQLYVGYGNIPVATSTIFVDTTQNYVGIGTTTPDTLFHVDGDGSFGRLCFNGDCIDSWTSAGIAIDSGRVVGQIAYWTDTNELGSTSTIPTGFGGTGKTSWNTDELIYSIDANTLGNITKGGNNTVFYIDSTGNYTWTATSSWDTNTQLAEQDITDFGFIKGLTLGNLYDVSTSSLATNHVLYWDGDSWETTGTSTWDTDTNTQLSDPEIGAFGYIKGLTLGNLWDVSTSSLATNHILYWDGDSWETSATTTWTHDMVTLAGTENYLTISGQEISVNEIDISEHTSLSVTALGLTLNDDTIELTNNYIIPLSASTTNWNNFYDTPSTVITAGNNIAWNGNQLDVADIWWSSLSEMPLTTGQLYVGYGNIPVATSTIFVDTTQNYVGIGTTTPDTLFHVDGDGSFGRLCFNGDCIDSWTSAGIAIDSGRVVGQIAYWTDTNELGSTSTIPTGFGGTGKTSWNSDELIYSIDANTLGNITKGGNNTVFYIDSSGNYTWTATSSWDTDTQLSKQEILDFGFIEGLTLGNLWDVSTTSLAINDVLYWTGTQWSRTGTSTWDTNTQLEDADISNLGYIKYLQLGMLSDVSTTSINTNDILYYNGTNWVVTATSTWDDDLQPLDSDLTTIAGLSPALNNMMYWNGANWALTATSTWDDNLQPLNAYLTDISGLSPSAYGEVIIWDGSGDWIISATSSWDTDTTYAFGAEYSSALTATTQTFATSTTGNDFYIVSSGSTHTFHLPDASGSSRGLLTSADWNTFNNKWDALTDMSLANGYIYTGYNGSPIATSSIFINAISKYVGIGTTSPQTDLDVYGNILLSGIGRYLTFGTTTGEGSYGLRDNNGTLEVRNEGGTWSTIGSGATNLGDLSNVTLGSEAYGDLLMYSGGNWINKATTSLGLQTKHAYLDDIAGLSPTIINSMIYWNGTDYAVVSTSSLGLPVGEGTAGQLAVWTDPNTLSASSTLRVAYGGTGLTSVGLGQMLVGNGSGGYTLTGTSSLGLYTGTVASGTPGWIPYYNGYNNNLTATSSLYIGANGYLGLGTTTPQYNLTVAGDLMLTGSIYDNNYDNGSWGELLMTTGSGLDWYATSSLGLQPLNGYLTDIAGVSPSVFGEMFYWNGTDFVSGATSTLGLLGSSVTASLSNNYLARWNGSSFIDSIIYDNGTYLGIGTNTPAYLLDVYASSSDYLTRIWNTSTSASSSGLYVRADGDGNLLTLNANGVDIFTVSEAQTTVNNPLMVAGAGDVTFSQDLIMANNTAGNIKFNGPGYIMTDSAWQNLNLTLQAANLGQVILDDNVTITGTTTIEAGNEIRFYNDSNTNYVGFKASTTPGGDYVWVLPTTVGGNGDALLVQADGTLEWGTPTGAGTNEISSEGYVTYYASNGSTVSGTSSLFIASSTNIGIGTMYPSEALSVVGNIETSGKVDAAGISIGNNNGIIFGSSNYSQISNGATLYELAFKTNSYTRLLINQDGYIGIGTTTPSSLLTVGTTTDSQFLVSFGGVVTDGVWNGDTIGIGYGGTGTSTAPSYGQMLIGNASGGYDYIASSSFGTSNVSAISDLSDVSEATRGWGDLLMWNGANWTDTATNTLGLQTSNAYLSDIAGLSPTITNSMIYWNGFDFVSVSTSSLGLLTLGSFSGLSNNTLPKWDGSDFGDSIISDDGSTATIAGAVTAGTTTVPSLTITGGTTLPASGVDGQMFYDTDDDEMYVYTGTRWQADRRTATVIVAASDSPNKERADYVCDGVNDEAEINQAIQEAYNNGTGGLVYLTEGTYTVGTSSYSGKSIQMATSTSLMGAGKSTVVKLKDGIDAFHVIVDSSNQEYVRLSSFKIDGNRENQLNNWHFGVRFSSVSTSSIENMIIENVDNSSSETVYVGSSNNIKISNNQVYNSDSHGIILNNSINSIVNNNIVSGVWRGIYTDNVSDNIIITDNILVNNTNGIYIYNTDNSIVSNNTVKNSISHGIWLASGSEQNTISNNLVSNSGTLNPSAVGIYIGTDCDDNVVSTNYITDVAGSGYAIEIVGTANNTLVTDNYYSGTGASAIDDSASDTKYTQPNRLTIDANDTDYNGAITALTVTQTGTGDLMNLVSDSTEIFTILKSGYVGIGTSSPVALLTVNGNALIEGLNRYLNFGTATGSVGYGFRDNDGTMQYKYAGGSWTNIGSSTVGSLNDINDTDLSSLAWGDMLYWNGSDWINEATSSLGLQPLDTELTQIAGLNPSLNNVMYWDGNSWAVTATSSWSNTYTAGDGLTLTGTEFDLDAALTTVTSIYNTALKIGRDSTDLIDFDTDNQITFRTNDSDVMLLDANGNLSIGTSTAGAKLTVMSDSGAQLRLSYDADTFVDFTVGSDGILNIGSATTTIGSGNDIITINSDGNVGIGSSSPNYTLSVNGDLMLTDALYDNNYDAGSWGEILMTTGSGIDWTATTSLGLQPAQAYLDDIAGLSPSISDSMIYWNGSDYTAVSTSSLGLTLASLIDTDESSRTWGDILMWNGTAWEDKATSTLGLGSEVASIADLDDVDDTGRTSGDLLMWNWAGDNWVDVATSTLGLQAENAGLTQIAGLSPSIENSMIYFNGSDYAVVATSSLGLTLADLTDTDESGRTWGDLLMWNGTDWKDMATSSLGLGSGTVGDGTTGQIAFYNADGTAVTGTSSLTINNQQQIVLLGGSAALPSLTFSGDTNTGLFNPLADTLGFSTGGSQMMTLDSSGYLGIGTTSPDYQLTIYGSGDLFKVATSGGDVFTITDSQITSYVPHSFAGSGDIDVSGDIYLSNTSQSNISSYGPLYLTSGDPGTNNNLYLEGRGEGSVYVDDALTVTGTTTFNTVDYLWPSSVSAGLMQANASGTLSWVSTSTLGLYAGTIASGTTGYIPYYADYSDSLSATSAIFIADTGYVGIGTTSPDERLTVAGDLGLTNQNEIRFYENVGNGMNYVGFKASSTNIASNVIWTLPNADGSANQLLKTDGNGNLYWTDEGAISGQWTDGGYAIYPSDNSGQEALLLGGDSTSTAEFVFDYNNNSWLDMAGNLGIGTTTPDYKLTLDGNFLITGSLYDNNYDNGSWGQLLMSTGSGLDWVSTSTLSLGTGSGTVGDGSEGQIAFYNADGTAVIGTSSLTINNQQQIVLLGGTAALPGLAISGDTNTGMFGLGSDILGFSTGGAEAFRIDASGNMMLGTSTAGSKLTVMDSSGSQLRLAYDANTYVDMTVQSNGEFLIQGSETSGSILQIGNNVEEDVGIIFDGNANDFWLAVDDTDDILKIGTSTTIGSSTILNILNNGYIGVGSSSPNYNFTVNGSLYATDIYTSSSTYYMDGKPVLTGNNLKLYNGDYYSGFRASSSLASDLLWSLPIADGSAGQVLKTDGNGNLYFASADASADSWSDSGSDIYFDTGNVGIGTNTPFKTLSVDGEAYITGTTTVSSLTITGGTTLPATGVDGQMFYDTDDDEMYVYTGTRWQADRRTATVIVAASDSPNKERADYVCDGVNDETEINQAIQEAYNSGTGGLVYLTEGTFTVGTSTYSNRAIQLVASTTIMGSGKNTIVKLADGFDENISIFYYTDLVDSIEFAIKNLTIDGNRDLQSSGTHYGILVRNIASSSIENLHIINIRNFALTLYDDVSNLRIVDNIIEKSGSCIDAQNALTNSVIANNTIANCDVTGILIDNLSNDNRIFGNTFNSVGLGIGVDGASNNNIISNNIFNNADTFLGYSIALTENSDDNVLIGNVIRTSGASEGVNISSGSDNNVISNNYYYGSGEYVNDSSGTSIYNQHNRTEISANDTDYGGAITALTVTQTGTGDLMNLVSDSTEIFTILKSGYVGIGTTTPGYDLTVAGDMMLTGGIYDNNYDNGNWGEVLMSTGSGLDWRATSSLGFQTSGDYLEDSDFSSNGIMVRTGSGAYSNVTLTGTANEITVANGDGSGAPTFSLPDEVYLGTAGKLGRDSQNLIDFTTDNQLIFRTNDSDQMRLDSSGNLMLGTSTPGAKLTVLSDSGAQLRLSYDSDTYTDFLVGSDGQLSITPSGSATTTIGSGDESMRITAGGLIGIGGIDPEYLLDVYASTTDYLTRIYNTSTSASSSGLYVRADGDGQLLTLNNNGSDIVTVSGAATVFNNPVQFGSAGDVSIAQDLIMTNGTAGNILFDGPGYIRTDSAWENLDLTLSAANLGDIVLSDTTVITGTTTIDDFVYFNTFTNKFGIGTSTPQVKMAIQGDSGQPIFQIASSTGAPIFTVNNNGKINVNGTTTSQYDFAVNGSIYATDVYTASSSFYMGGKKVLSLFDGIKLFTDLGAGTYSTALKASTTQSSDLTMYLPGSYGNSGQVLTTDGSGQMYWSDASASTLAALTDTNIGTTNWGDLLMWDGNDWVDRATSTLGIEGGSSVASIADLDDVDDTGRTVGDLLMWDWDDSNWVDVATNTLGLQPQDSDLTQIAGLSPSTNDLIYWNGSSWAVTATSTWDDYLQPLDAYLTDIAGLSPSISNSMIYWNGSDYTAVATSSLGLTLDVLTDTNISSPDWGEVLMWNGSDWINYATSSLGIEGGSASVGGSDGMIQYNNGGSAFGGAAELYWDDVNDRFGIGSSSPSSILTVQSVGNQLTLAYDADNFTNFQTDANGKLNITTSASDQSALTIGSGADKDAGVIMDGASVDFAMGIDKYSDTFRIGTSTNIGSSTAVTITSQGYVGIGSTTDPLYTLDVHGTARSTMGWVSGGADYAEYFYTLDADLQPGETVCVDVTQGNAVKRCTRDADSNVMGIVSTHPAIVGNNNISYNDNDNYKIIGMLGQVPARVSTENGAIRPGDSLAAASEPGYIRKANAGEATVGVALESFGLNTDEHGLLTDEYGEDQATTTEAENQVASAEVGEINVLISRRNKSLTVDLVEQKITENIANMEIEDEVVLMLESAIDNYNLASSTKLIVDNELALFNQTLDAQLTVNFDAVTGSLLSVATSVDNLIMRMDLFESNIVDIDSRLLALESSWNYNNTAVSTTSDRFIETGEDGLLITDDYGLVTDITEHGLDDASSSVEIYEQTGMVEIVTATSSIKTAFVVNQKGTGDVADFQSDGVSIVTIQETGRVSVVGEMMVDGRLMICSGGACGSSLDLAVDETMGDMGVEGKVVAGAFEGYCEDGYIWVPGSAKYGTLPGFCVETDEHGLGTDITDHGSSTSWTNVSQGEASLACQAEGGGYHLITENEWLTIAENVIRVIDNDCEEYLDGLQLLVAGDSSATSSLIWATSSQIAFVLSNGNYIYDLAGGVSEWTDQIITKAGIPELPTSNWEEYYNVTDYKGYNIAPAYYYSQENGIGQIMVGENDINLRGFVRGQTALYDLDLSHSPTETSNDIGFRCAK